MEPGYRFRLYLLTAVILVGYGALVSRLFTFQIERQDEFLANMPSPTEVSVRDPGVRGEIVDRNNIPLATNLRNYEMSFNLEEIHNAYRRMKREANEEELAALEVYPDTGKKIVTITDIVNRITIPALKKLDLAKPFNERDFKREFDVHYLTNRGHVPYIYRHDLTFEQFARVAENSSALPGVSVKTTPERIYPYGSLASHILGKVKGWNNDELPEDAKKRFDYYTGDSRGIEGIEATMDEFLRGYEGARAMLKDVKGNTVDLPGEQKLPGQGSTVELTIDARIQRLTEKVLRRAGRAAAIVMEVNTGEIISMASVPDFDPNDFIPPVSSDTLKNYNQNKAGPFTNKVISPFAPGSTFKIPTAVAGFMNGIDGPTLTCNGYVQYGNHPAGCWIYNKFKGKHGPLTLEQAIQQSSEKKGILPGSREWTRKKGFGTPFKAVEQAFLSIGQGETAATPLQICNFLCAVANGGRLYEPRIIKQVTHSTNGTLIEDEPQLRADLLEHNVTAEQLARIRKGMYMAVNEPQGTGKRSALPNISICGKTGTAQTTIDGVATHNAWTIAFAPYEQPKYAVVVVVRHGGSGGKVAGPLVRLIMDGLFKQESGVRLPLDRMTPYAGHSDRIEEIFLDDDDPLLLALDNGGETGNEIRVTVPDSIIAPNPNTSLEESSN